MRYQYYNANPLQRQINDCTVRAISMATGKSWNSVYDELSEYAKQKAFMPDEVECIDIYLEENFEKLYGCRDRYKITVEEFVQEHPIGTYLITMNGHITCCRNGCIYDTFDPSDRFVWGAYKV